LGLSVLSPGKGRRPDEHDDGLPAWQQEKARYRIWSASDKVGTALQE